MNKAILIGRLTRDPEQRQTQSGISCATFTLAVPRRVAKDGERQADFINIVAWRQLADLCARYLKQGRQVSVIGQIQTRNYTAQDGTKRYITEVIADEVEFLGSKDDGKPEEKPVKPEDDDSDELPFD